MYVYFIQADTGGPVKIGKASRPDRRLANLQGAHWNDLRMLAVCLGGYGAEYTLHRHFAEDRVRGEWFNPVPALLDIISRLPSWDQVEAGAFCPEIINPELLAIRDLYARGYTLEDCAELVPWTRQRLHQMLAGLKDRKASVSVNARLPGGLERLPAFTRPPRPDTPVQTAYARALEDHASLEFTLPAES